MANQKSQKSFKQLYKDYETTERVIEEKQEHAKEVYGEIMELADSVVLDKIHKKYGTESKYLNLVQMLQAGSIDIKLVNITEGDENSGEHKQNEE